MVGEIWITHETCFNNESQVWNEAAVQAAMVAQVLVNKKALGSFLELGDPTIDPNILWSLLWGPPKWYP